MGAGLNGIIFDDLFDDLIRVSRSLYWPFDEPSTQVEYLKNGAFYGQSYSRTLIGNHTQYIE